MTNTDSDTESDDVTERSTPSVDVETVIENGDEEDEEDEGVSPDNADDEQEKFLKSVHLADVIFVREGGSKNEAEFAARVKAIEDGEDENELVMLLDEEIEVERKHVGASEFGQGPASVAATKKAVKHIEIHFKLMNFKRKDKERLFAGKRVCYKNLVPSQVTEGDMNLFGGYLCQAKQLKSKTRKLSFNTVDRYFSSIKMDLSNRHMTTNLATDKVDWTEAVFKRIRAGTLSSCVNSK
jgi:hypothetical protein